jgi:hypothetical protein
MEENQLNLESKNYKKISQSSNALRKNMRNNPTIGNGRTLSSKWKKNTLSIDVTAPGLMKDSEILEQSNYFGILADLIRIFSYINSW